MLDTLLAKLTGRLSAAAESTALSMMDGPLKPNRRLDDAQPIGAALPDCDDLCRAPEGELLVSSGTAIQALHGANLEQRSVWFECEGTVSALAAAGSAVYAGIAGVGVVRIENGSIAARLEAVDGQPLRCVTAITLLADGRIAIAEGSAHNLPQGWSRDLLERRASGRVIICRSDLSSPATLLSGLAWPNGLAATGATLWYSESWRHRLQEVPLSGGSPRTVLHNLPGYPARIAADGNGGWWLAVFAVRTQLLEFVLRERAYREEMLASVDPRYWIAPSLSATGHYLEPLQGGSIKKLGIVKPWAPPRSYGLVLRLSASGEMLDSLHSRAGGIHHGITAVQAHGDALIALSRGSARVLLCHTGAPP